MATKVKIKDTPRKRLHFEVLLEAMHTDIKKVAEGHYVLDKKIDDFRYETRNEFSLLRIFQSNTTNRLKDIDVSLVAIGNNY